MSFIPHNSGLRSKRVPENFADFQLQPPSIARRIPLGSDDHSTTIACQNPQSDSHTEEEATMAVSADLFDFLKVDDKNDNLCALPTTTQHRVKLSGFKTHAYNGLPALKQSDVSENDKRGGFHDPDKDAPWEPDDVGDALTAAHVKHRTLYELERRKKKLSSRRKQRNLWEERSWTRALMSNRLKPEFAKCMDLWNKRMPQNPADQSDEDLTDEEACDILLSMSSQTPSASPEAFVYSPDASSSTAATISSSNYQSDHELNDDEASKILLSISSGTRSPSPEAFDSASDAFLASAVDLPLFEDWPAQSIEPLRRIMRCKEHLERPSCGKPDNRPTWAKRGALPDAETKAAQLNVQSLAVGLWESVEGRPMGLSMLSSRTPRIRAKSHRNLLKPLWSKSIKGVDVRGNDQRTGEDDSLLTVWKFLEREDNGETDKAERDRKGERAKWEAYTSNWASQDSADIVRPMRGEEYDILAEQHDALDDIFDEPEYPVGVFDEAEVDYCVERERQKEIKKLRAQGATDDQLEDWHQNIFGTTSKKIDELGEEARQALVASRKLLPKVPPKASPKSPMKSPSTKRKRESLQDAEPLPASKRPRREKPTEKAHESSPGHNSHSATETHQLESKPTEKAEESSPGRKRVTIKLAVSPAEWWRLHGEEVHQ